MIISTPDDNTTGQNDRALATRIRAIIAQNGPITFAQFMQMALYDPDAGYYSAASSPLFGVTGDFITAPEMGSLFADCLARQCAQVLQELPQSDILEYGAGSGKLAFDLLHALQRIDCLPRRYLIDEISPVLRQRQQEMLSGWNGTTSIEWLSAGEREPFAGVILANEVLDALPFHCLVLRGGKWWQRCVGNSSRPNEFCWHELPLDSKLQPFVPSLPGAADDYIDGYLSECRSNMVSWLAAATAALQRGLVLCVDYGYPRHEYLHPQRHMGTMLCHSRHTVEHNPLRCPGRLDITASVDFTALADAAVQQNLDICGYASQAGFLLSLGAAELATNTAARRELNGLLYHGAMGERFQVMAMARGLQGLTPCAGFTMQDHRWRLALYRSDSIS